VRGPPSPPTVKELGSAQLHLTECSTRPSFYFWSYFIPHLALIGFRATFHPDTSGAASLVHSPFSVSAFFFQEDSFPLELSPPHIRRSLLSSLTAIFPWCCLPPAQLRRDRTMYIYNVPRLHPAVCRSIPRFPPCQGPLLLTPLSPNLDGGRKNTFDPPPIDRPLSPTLRQKFPRLD